MIPTIIGATIGLFVCLILVYVTKFLSNTVENADESSKNN